MRAVVLVCLVTAACGGDSLRVEEWQTRYVEASCRYLVRCGLYPDVATCQAHDRSTIDPDLVAGVHAGIIEWHPEVAEACNAVFEDLTCDRTSAA